MLLVKCPETAVSLQEAIQQQKTPTTVLFKCFKMFISRSSAHSSQTASWWLAVFGRQSLLPQSAAVNCRFHFGLSCITTSTTSHLTACSALPNTHSLCLCLWAVSYAWARLCFCVYAVCCMLEQAFVFEFKRCVVCVSKTLFLCLCSVLYVWARLCFRVYAVCCMCE